MEASFPQQEGRGPGDVGIELVVQRASAEHANSHCSENDRHDEIRGDALGHGVLISGLAGGQYELEELAD